MEKKAKGNMTISKTKAMIDNATRRTPLVRVLAYVINREAAAIRPMAIKEAHILSKEDIVGITLQFRAERPRS